jgi:biopolymer transport protein ExbD
MKLPSRDRSHSVDLQMTAMIDVVFLLLVFFLWTSSFEKPEFDLASALSLPPVGNSSTNLETVPVLFDEIVIRIVSTGNGVHELRLNESVYGTNAELLERLTSIATLGVQPAVIVHPDSSVPMETAIAVYDSARAAGFDRVLFTASP